MDSMWLPKLILLGFLLYQSCPSTDGKSFEEDLTLTYAQKVKLDKFKDLVAPRLPHKWMSSESYLIRWLRARNYNLKDAENMLMNYVQWRQENDIDHIFEEDWSEYREYKTSLDSRDKEGRPILYVYAGDWDIRRGLVSGKSERLMRYVDMRLEEACKLVRDMSHTYKNVSQGILILNADGFNAVQHACLRCIPFLLRIVLASEIHHPGCSEKIILANIPSIAEPIIQAARGVFSAPTNEALIVLGTNKKQVKDTLLQYVDREQLPQELGGTKVYKYGDDGDDNEY